MLFYSILFHEYNHTHTNAWKKPPRHVPNSPFRHDLTTITHTWLKGDVENEGAVAGARVCVAILAWADGFGGGCVLCGKGGGDMGRCGRFGGQERLLLLKGFRIYDGHYR